MYLPLACVVQVETREKAKERPEGIGPPDVVVGPLIFHYDKTHLDANGNYVLAPRVHEHRQLLPTIRRSVEGGVHAGRASASAKARRFCRGLDKRQPPLQVQP